MAALCSVPIQPTSPAPDARAGREDGELSMHNHCPQLKGSGRLLGRQKSSESNRLRQMWRDHQGKQRCSQVPNWIRIRASVPVPSGPLLLPAGCSAELSQLLQTFPLLPLLLGHQLSAAEEESPHQGDGKTRKTAIRGKAALSTLSPHMCHCLRSPTA